VLVPENQIATVLASALQEVREAGNVPTCQRNSTRKHPLTQRRVVALVFAKQAQSLGLMSAEEVTANCFSDGVGQLRTHDSTNAKDHRPGATGIRLSTEVSSPGSLHLVC
jgi:hypothetical protein